MKFRVFAFIRFGFQIVHDSSREEASSTIMRRPRYMTVLGERRELTRSFQRARELLKRVVTEEKKKNA